MAPENNQDHGGMMIPPLPPLEADLPAIEDPDIPQQWEDAARAEQAAWESRFILPAKIEPNYLVSEQVNDFPTDAPPSVPEHPTEGDPVILPWSLNVTDSAAGEFTLNPGSIKSNNSDYDTAKEVAITNIGSAFTAAAGSVLYLEKVFTPAGLDDVTAVELKLGTWANWPEKFEYETTAFITKLKAFRKVLWRFVSITGTAAQTGSNKASDTLRVSPSILAVRMCEREDFVVQTVLAYDTIEQKMVTAMTLSAGDGVGSL